MLGPRDLPPQIVKAIVVPASANLSRTEADKLESYVKSMGSKGLARAKLGDTPILLLTPDFDDGKAAIAATQSQRRRI